MTLVRILRNYPYPDLLRQTPQGKGLWDGVQYLVDQSGPCDYAVILNGVNEKTVVHCAPEHVWALMQEPPTEYKRKLHRGNPAFHQIFTQDAGLHGERYVLSQPALPWHIDKTFDELVNCPVPEKTGNLSWVTSNLANLKGHRRRMRFLTHLQEEVAFDLYGRGFNFLKNKWDGIAPYRYSLAVENFRNEYYWSEKIADCFLAWTMPIYYGCAKITDYFPAEAIILLDEIDTPEALRIVKDASRSDRWKKSLDAIAYARELVLMKYQLFPFISGKIHESIRLGGAQPREVDDVWIPPLPAQQIPLRFRVNRYIKHLQKILLRF